MIFAVLPRQYRLRIHKLNLLAKSSELIDLQSKIDSLDAEITQLKAEIKKKMFFKKELKLKLESCESQLEQVKELERDLTSLYFNTSEKLSSASSGRASTRGASDSFSTPPSPEKIESTRIESSRIESTRIPSSQELSESKHVESHSDLPSLGDLRRQSSFMTGSFDAITARYLGAESMPDCFEKSVVLLQLYFESELHRSSEKKSILTIDEVQNIMDNMKAQLKEEGIRDNDIVKAFADVLSSVTSNIQTLSIWNDSWTSGATERPREVIENCNNACFRTLQEIRVFDFDILKEAIDATEAATVDIKDKDVILLVGGTGAGKSTFLHFLSGAKLKRTVNYGGKIGMNHIEVVECVEGLESVTVSPFMKSETKGIRAVGIKKSDDVAVFVCDSAGLFDTKGCEVEIANGSLMARAMHSCRSVKLVLFITQPGLRLENLCDFLISLQKFVKHLGDDRQEGTRILDSVYYVLSRMTFEEAASLSANAEDKLKKLEPFELTQVGLVATLRDIKEKTKIDEKGSFQISKCCHPNILNDSRTPIIDAILNLPGISNPKDVFCDFASAASVSSLKRQVELNEKSIHQAFRRGRFDLITYKLNQLKMLGEKTKLGDCEAKYNACIVFIAQKIGEFKDNVFALLKKIYDVTYNVTEREKGEFIKFMSQIRDIQGSELSEMITTSYESSTNYLEIICNNIYILHKALIEEIERKLISCELCDTEFSNQALRKLKNNVTFLTGVATESSLSWIVELNAVLIEKINVLWNEKYNSFKSNLVNLDSVKALEDLEKVKNLLVLEEHISLTRSFYDGLEQQYSEKISAVANQLTAKLTEIENNSVDQDIFIQNYIHFFDQLRYIIANNASPASKTFPAISTLVKLTLDDMVDKVNRKIYSLKDVFVKNVTDHIVNPFSSLSGSLAVIEKLREEKMTSDTASSYTDLIQTFVLTIERARNAAESNIYKVDQDSVPSLAYDIVLLKDATCFNGHSPQIYKDEYEVILSQLSDAVGRCSSTRIAYDSLDTVHDVHHQVSFLSKLEEKLMEYKLFEIVSNNPFIVSNREVSLVEWYKESVYECVNQAIIVLESWIFDTSSEVFPWESSAVNISKTSDAINYLDDPIIKDPLVYGGILEKVDSLVARISDHSKNFIVHINTASEQDTYLVWMKRSIEYIMSFSASKEPQETSRLLNVFDKHFKDSKLAADAVLEGFLSRISPYTIADHNADVGPIISNCKLCSKLTMFDDFIRKDEKFKDYEFKLRAIISKSESVIDSMLAKKEFEQLKAYLDNHRDLQQYNKILKDIVEALTEECDQIEKYTNSQSVESINQCCEKLKWLTRCIGGDLFIEHFSPETSADLKKRFDAVLDNLFSVYSLRLEKVGELGNLRRFLEGEMTIAFAKYFSKQLEEIDSELNLNVTSRISTSLIEKVAESRGKLDDCIKTLPYSSPIAFDSLKEHPPINMFNGFDSLIADLQGDSGAVRPTLFDLIGGDYASSILSTYISAKENLQTLFISEYETILTNVRQSNVESETAEAPEVNLSDVDLTKSIEKTASMAAEREMPSAASDEDDGRAFDNLSVRDCEQLLTEIDQSRKYFPDGFFNSLQSQIDAAALNIEKMKEDIRNKAKEAVEQEDLTFRTNLLSYFIYYYKQLQLTKAEEIYKYLFDKLEKTFSEFEAELNRGIFHIAKVEDSFRFFCNFHIEVITMNTLRLKRRIRDPRTGRIGSKDFALPDKAILNLLLKFVSLSRKYVVEMTNYFIRTDEKLWESPEEKFQAVLYAAGLNDQSTSESPLLKEILRGKYIEVKTCATDTIFQIARILSDSSCKVFEELMTFSNSYGQKRLDIRDLEYFVDNFAANIQSLMKIKVSSTLVPSLQLLASKNLANLTGMVWRTYSQIIGLYDSFYSALTDFVKMNHSADRNVTTANASDRTDHFRKLAASYALVMTIEPPPGTTIDKEYMIRCTIDQVERIEGNARSAIEATDYDNFNKFYDSLRAFGEAFFLDKFKFQPVADKVKISKQFTEKSFVKHVDTIVLRILSYREIINDTSLETTVSELIDLKTMSNQVALFKSVIDTKIDEVLSKYMEREKVFQMPIISKMANILNRIGNDVSSQIINDHDAFEGDAIFNRNLRIQAKNPQTLLASLRGDNCEEENKERLLYHCEEFYKKYNSLVNSGLTKIVRNPRDEADNILTGLATASRDLVKENMPQPMKIRDLIAHIFAHWTLSKAKHYKDYHLRQADQKGVDTGDEEGKNLLLQPHGGQILALMRIFGLDQEDIEDVDTLLKYAMTKAKNFVKSFLPSNIPLLRNHMVEIGTGEGKSVTLAVASIVIGLMGYKVDIVCYSPYLSQRDRASFEGMYESFGLPLDSFITYGTFTQLCEKFLNSKGNIRDIIAAMIQENKTVPDLKPMDECRRVLLVDEADVFFDEDFYCGKYSVLAKITSPDIKKLIRKIWSMRQSEDLFKYRTWDEYKVCLNAFSNWKFIIEEAVKTLVRDVRSFENHNNYQVDDKNDRIGYPVRDAIEYKKNYPYKTLFAYFKENSCRRITDKGLDDNIYLIVNCGAFSYAEIPKLYDYIVGVTGTLGQLIDRQREILKNEYNVHVSTFVPSVYRPLDDGLVFPKDKSSYMRMENDLAFNTELVNEIKDRLEGESKATPRAILVFFETEMKLHDFLESQEFADYRSVVRTMNENMRAADRDQAIRAAVTSGSITLLTKNFGRGTDFYCFDTKLDATGGVHVIQTFVSTELSEEVQIRGRTARQGNKGTYSMVLNENELEKFGFTFEEIVSVKQGHRYKLINEKRNQFFEQKYGDAIARVQGIKEEHKETTEHLDRLFDRDGFNVEEIKQFIESRNKSSYSDVSDNPCRTIVIMDATLSMTELLGKCKDTVNEMFENTYHVLNENNVGASFLIQFAVYRNYSSKAVMLFQPSGWTNEPTDMASFMNDCAYVQGGQGNEAIEIALWHANREFELYGGIDQVIVIGDAPPNTKANIDNNRKGVGESYWQSAEGGKYAKKTFYLDEIEKLKSRNVPVHAFYVAKDKKGERVKPKFEEMASMTGGISNFLDIFSEEGAKLLTGTICTRVLEKVGDRSGIQGMGERLKKSYEQTFGYVDG